MFCKICVFSVKTISVSCFHVNYSGPGVEMKLLHEFILRVKASRSMFDFKSLMTFPQKLRESSCQLPSFVCCRTNLEGTSGASDIRHVRRVTPETNLWIDAMKVVKSFLWGSVGVLGEFKDIKRSSLHVGLTNAPPCNPAAPSTHCHSFTTS